MEQNSGIDRYRTKPGMEPALESWSQQKTMQEFSVTKHNVENLKKEKAILADQTDAKRADLLHVQLHADYFHPCPVLLCM